MLDPRITKLAEILVKYSCGLKSGDKMLVEAIDVGAGRMPIGIFTAVIGGPTFIWLLQRRRGAS